MMKRALCLLMAVVLVCLPLVALGEEASEEKVLIIGGDWYGTDMNPAFEELYPEIRIRSPSFSQWDTITVLTQIMMPSAPTDIFNFQVSRGMLEAVHRKGYCTYFAPGEALQAAQEGWPAFVRELVTDDKGVFAIPVTLTSEELMGFNPQVGEALGIAPPTSLEEVMEIFAQWHGKYLDAAEENGYYLSSFFVERSFYYFLERGTNMYLASCGEPITFDTARYRAFVEKLVALKPGFDALRDERDAGLLAEDPDTAAANTLFCWSEPLLHMSRTDDDYFVSMPVSLLRGEEICVPVDLSAAIIPPNAVHPGNALCYLETMMENYPTDVQILFSPDTAQPVETANYASTMAYMEALIADTQARLDACEDPLERLDLEGELDVYEEEHQHFLTDWRYDYTVESIASYRALVPWMRQMPSVSYSYYNSQPNMHALFEQLAQGRLSVERFIAQFDQLQQMMNEENQ